MSNIRCFEFGLSELLDVSLWLKWGSILANIATCIAVIVAIFAAFIAYNQLKSSKEEERKSTAYEIYHQYLLLCINNPQFAEGMKKTEIKTEEYKRYRWFVSTMLFSFEQIIDTQPNDSQWSATVKSQLIKHKELLEISRTVKENEWSTSLNSIIIEVIKPTSSE